MDKRRKARKSRTMEKKSDEPVEDNTKGDVKVSEAELEQPSKNEQGQGDPEAGLTREPLYDISKTIYFQRLNQTFRDARSRRALVCASTAMVSQQLCGINTIGMYCLTSKYSKRYC